jgi:hypothetical protein
MNRSEQIHELATALAKAQAEMKPADLARTNPHFKSRFAGLPEVREAAKVLHKHGLAYTQDVWSEGENCEIVCCATTIMHSSGQWKESPPLKTKLAKATMQEAGSAITYLRRYSLSAELGIVADDDDDGEAATRGKNGNGAHATQPPLAPEDQRKTVAEWKAEMEAAPNKVALQGVAARIARAKDAGLLNEADVEKELNPVWATKIKALNGQVKA